MLQTAHATHGFTYAKALAASEKSNWRVEDIIGGGRRLDFGKPFMPESLARVGGLDFLDAEARLKLNHIRANGYLYTFGLVEEFILPFVLDHARPMLAEDACARGRCCASPARRPSTSTCSAPSSASSKPDLERPAT